MIEVGKFRGVGKSQRRADPSSASVAQFCILSLVTNRCETRTAQRRKQGEAQLWDFEVRKDCLWTRESQQSPSAPKRKRLRRIGPSVVSDARTWGREASYMGLDQHTYQSHTSVHILPNP